MDNTITFTISYWSLFWSIIIAFIIIVIPWFWGVSDMYVCKRWLAEGKKAVDQSAGALHYWFVKWAIAMQSKLVAEKLGFPSKDLNEILKIRDDDNKI